MMPSHRILLLLLIPISQILADQTLDGLTVRLYHDYDCKGKSGILSPSSNNLKTTCRKLESPTPHSFIIAEQSGECSVVFYGDPTCSFNATRAPTAKPLGTCISSDNYLSFGLECGSDASTSSSTSPKATPSPEATGSSIPASQPPSANPGTGNNGGLSTAGTIAIGVILPTASIIVAIVFGIRMWNSGFNSKKAGAFTKLPMDNRGAQPPPPPEVSAKTTAGKKNAEFGIYPLKPLDSQSPPPPPPPPLPPNEFNPPPRYKTNAPLFMPKAAGGQPWDNQNIERATPQGFAELPVNGSGGHTNPLQIFAEVPMNNSGRQSKTPTANAELASNYSPSPPRGTIELSSSLRTGTHLTSPTGFAELPINNWEGHSSAQRGGFAELPTHQR